MNTMHTQRLSIAALVFVAAFPCTANAVEIDGGAGTTGAEIGVALPLSDAFAARLDYNALRYTRSFTTDSIDYDAKLKASNAGLYLDYFVSGGLRVTGGALIGSRKFHGTAKSIGNTVKINGVLYPTTAADTLDFDAKFPTVTPYLGIGYGHGNAAPGLHLYVDAGVAYGRPKVALSPSASLLTKVNPVDLAGEQNSAQDEANSLRAYPVLKLGINYRF